MTTAADREGLREALVRAITSGAFGKHYEAADAFLAGPLAQADTAAQAVATVERLSFTDETGATWRPVPGWSYMALHKKAEAALAEVARLSAEVEALRQQRDAAEGSAARYCREAERAREAAEEAYDCGLRDSCGREG